MGKAEMRNIQSDDVKTRSEHSQLHQAVYNRVLVQSLDFVIDKSSTAHDTQLGQFL